jgi:type II secretory pathway component PulF
VAIVRAGEHSADLPTALRSLADSYERREKFGRVVLSALLYPAFLLLVSIGALAVIAFFVAPSLNDLFVSMGKAQPTIIKLMVDVSKFLSANWSFVIGLGVGTTAIVGLASSRTQVRRGVTRAFHHAPLVGTAMTWSATGKLASVLHICLSSHVPAADAISVAVEASGLADKATSRAIIAKLRSGSTISAAIASNQLLPEKALELLRVGERSNRLLSVLEAIASEAEARMNTRLAMVASLLSPILILCVGVIAGTIIYNVFSALLDLNQLAQ